MVRSHEEFSLKVWPGKKRRRVESYNRWKFRGPKICDVNGLLLAVENKKVIGQLGFIPVKLRYKKKIYDAQWACDLMVDPDYRKLGIGSRLFKEGMKREAISLGNNASPRADRLMLNMGFRPLQSGRLMFFPLDARHLLKWVVPSKIDFTIPVLNKLIQPYFYIKKNLLKQKETNIKICAWEDVFDQIVQRQRENNSPHILHDMDFMNWRATGLENFSKRIDAAKNNDGSYALHNVFLPYYNVYEWHCKDLTGLKSLIALLLNLAIKNKASTLQMVANNNEEEKWLSSLGFIKSRNKERIINYSKDNIFTEADKFYFTLYDTDLNL